MRIDSSSPSVVILPACPGTRGQAFRALLERPANSTALSPNTARVLLGNAWAGVFGQPADAKTSALLTAHWALETDAGRAMPGFNFAGIKASAAAPGAELRTVEGHGATRREVSARFRVYDSAEAGAHDYVSLLKSRYPAAIEAARAGDAPAFSRALAQGGYFTADPHAYASGLAQRLAEVESGTLSGGVPSAPAPGSLNQLALGNVLHSLQRSPATETEEDA